MPTYQYRCTECGRDLEAVQKFSDASLTECPTCAGVLRKVFNAVGVVFKGSGFYRTDSRKGSDSDVKAESSNGEKKSEKADKAEKSSEKGTETKPVKNESSKPTKSDKVASGSSSSSTGAKAATS